MAGLAGVTEVHDLHIWEVTSGFPALSAHVLVGRRDRLPRRPPPLERILHEKSGSTTRPPGRPRGRRTCWEIEVSRREYPAGNRDERVTAAATTKAWKISWKPNVLGHGFGLRRA